MRLKLDTVRPIGGHDGIFLRVNPLKNNRKKESARPGFGLTVFLMEIAASERIFGADHVDGRSTQVAETKEEILQDR
ncbi:MAG: hypothetical protein V4466_05965 [Pseudomonadota bacterium]